MADKVAKGRQSKGQPHSAIMSRIMANRDQWGEKSPVSKLTDAQWTGIKGALAKGALQREVASEFGISQAAISMRLKRETRRAHQA